MSSIHNNKGLGLSFTHRPQIVEASVPKSIQLSTIPLPDQPSLLIKNKKFSKLVLSIIVSYIQDLAQKIANLVLFICNKIFDSKSKNYNNLIKSKKEISPGHSAWYLNLAFIQEIAQHPEITPLERKQLQFLASNYLHKTAPIHLKTIKSLSNKLESYFQISKYAQHDDRYHRASIKRHLILAEKPNEAFALSKESPLILTDSNEIDGLLRLKFKVSDENYNQELFNIFDQCLENAPSSLDSPLDPSILFDFTTKFSEKMSSQNSESIRKELNEFKLELSNQIQSKAKELAKKYPQFTQKQLQSWIKKSMTVICKVQNEEVTGLKVLPLFRKLANQDVIHAHPQLMAFVVATGIGIGAISLRRHFLDSLNDDKEVEYGVPQQKLHSFTPTLYHRPEDFLNSLALKKLQYLFTAEAFDEKKLGFSQESPIGSRLVTFKEKLVELPQIHLYGKACSDLFSHFFKSIPQQNWDRLINHPAYNQLLQVTLHKMMINISNLEMYYADFNKFSQEIDLLLAEFTTLLELSPHFTADDFKQNYAKLLKNSIPPTLHPFIKTSLGKTSVNVFAGIFQASVEQNPHAKKIHAEGLYYEEAGFTGYENEFDRVFSSDENLKVNLYAGQFNPNIEIRTDFTHYKKHDIAADIKTLLSTDKASEHLTVAIDITIDDFHSSNVHHLLTQFEKEIAEGRLNFVFFRSGQKLDMLGCDNFYGAPFYLVNNGAKQWQKYNEISEKAVHQTDNLSLQWFTLSLGISDSLEQYRKLIFDNTRDILNAIPDNLKPAEDLTTQNIRINTVSDDMSACFIDMKVTGNMHKIKALALIGLFYQEMLAKGIKVLTRSTFGLPNPNCILFSTDIKDSTTIRFHPGLNAQETQAFIDYFNLVDKIYSNGIN